LLPLADGIRVQARVKGGGDDEALVIGANQRLPQLRRKAGSPLRIDLMLEDASKHRIPNLAPCATLHATVCHFLPLLGRQGKSLVIAEGGKPLVSRTLGRVR